MKNRWIGTAAGILCMALLLGGCRIGNHEIMVSGSLTDKQVFKMEHTVLGLKEAKVYLANYQNIYGTAYGLDLWRHDFGDQSLTEYVKDLTIEELVRVVCMDLLAETREMALTEEETDGMREAAKEYYASLTKEELAYLGVSENDLFEYYTHYALAQKLYHSLISSVNEEVSDDEARVIEIMQIFVADQGSASEVSRKLKDGDDFASLANTYNQLDSIQVTVARDDLPKEVEEEAFQLDNGEISGKIKTEDGYYFVKCLNKYEEKLTEANKSNIVEKREKEAFDDVYNAFVDGLSSEWNQELWEGLELDTGEAIATDSFFETYEKYSVEK